MPDQPTAKPTFPNFADRYDVDQQIADELKLAGINVAVDTERPGSRDASHVGEVHTLVTGDLLGWTFRRRWCYYLASGPGLPADVAEELHAAHGREVRVNGIGTAPSPSDYYRGLACGRYHVDTQRGLNALTAALRQVVADHAARSVGV